MSVHAWPPIRNTKLETALIASAFVFAMPPIINHFPNHSCKNYPVCKQIAAREVVDKKRKFLDHCTGCNKRSCCQHPACNDRAAPGTRLNPVNELCSLHLSDPCHADKRYWAQCKHAASGYLHLSMKTGGGKCYACDNNNLPCVF